MSREVDFRTLVVRADPNFVRSSKRVAEYEFSAPARSRLRASSDRDDTTENSLTSRVFYGEYQTRGAYTPQADVDGGLVWGGRQITWNGIPLTWGDE